MNAPGSSKLASYLLLGYAINSSSGDWSDKAMKQEYLPFRIRTYSACFKQGKRNAVAKRRARNKAARRARRK